jgi:restriction system protein
MAPRRIAESLSRRVDSRRRREYAERVPARLVLIDGVRLAELLVLHNVGVQDEETFTLKRVDEDFFEAW